ncbi:MAG: NCS2 family permease [Treponema sp.]|jgi:AGZA family xanthine/uracil permease-like MFS transporter|nr:NCS2 family permease [Treponema sp.]
MDKFFGISGSGSNIRTEVLAGFTTFFTMAYIMFVNPSILSASGMSWNGVFVATIIATAIGTLIMGLVAKVPYAVAPGMGLNAFFTFSVCFGLGFKWQEALAMVFICGIINIIITVTRLRKMIIKSIPKSLQLAIGGGIGLFIAYIGIKNAGLINFGATSEGFTPGANAVPALSQFNAAGPVLALIGLAIIVILMMLKVRGAMLIGIIATTVIGIPMGITHLPEKIFDMSRLSEIGDVSFAFFGDVGFASLFGEGRIFIVLITIFAFSLTDTFDTIGTFIGTGRKTGIFDEADEKALNESKGFKSKMDKALFADATATSIGALFGTSNTTTYIESASGISEGGRTGFTSVIVAALFLICLPLVALFGMVPAQATAPVLIIVGILMAESFAGINWKDLDESIPAFFTITIMTFAYNISYGIAAGFIFFCIVKICKKQIKEVHPILIGAALLFIFYFILMAVNKL